MLRSIICFIIISLAFTVCACSEKGSVDEKEVAESPGPKVIRIIFHLPGDDIGSPEHRAALNRIITSIRSAEAGEVVSSGFAMGSMDVTVKIKGVESIREIQRIITDNYPEADYSITKPLPPVS